MLIRPCVRFVRWAVRQCFSEKGLGAKLWDVDGKEYIDYINSWGPMIVGHAHPEVISAVQAAAAKSLSFGAPTGLELEMAELPHQARAKYGASSLNQ